MVEMMDIASQHKFNNNPLYDKFNVSEFIFIHLVSFLPLLKKIID